MGSRELHGATAQAKVGRLENPRQVLGSGWPEHPMLSEGWRGKGSRHGALKARPKNLERALGVIGSHRWFLSRTSCQYLRKIHLKATSLLIPRKKIITVNGDGC